MSRWDKTCRPENGGNGTYTHHRPHRKLFRGGRAKVKAWNLKRLSCADLDVG